MKRMILVFALLAGCQASPSLAPRANEAANVPASAHASFDNRSALTGKVWVRTNSTGLPGDFRLFLANRTLLIDSCWETYRLAHWTMTSDSTLRWREGHAAITADVISLTDKQLVLQLNLTSGPEIQRFTAASVPYLCPDMPR